MNFKDRFLELTKYTVPFGYEETLEYALPKGWTKDNIGNYFYKIGVSKTLFTSHLDTACKERDKVNHVIDGNIIKTDGTTILGGDNKAGCLVLFYLIENRIPGTYYFFIGEEAAVHSNYPHGSLLAIEENPNLFKKFDRVITFDRKEKDQLITRQLGRNCCSEIFADSLISEFSKNGIEYKKDNTGYYTDSAFFIDIIPEITNLSVGVWNEHTTNEYVDIKYIEQVARAAKDVKWDNLPTSRKLDSKYEVDSRKDIEGNVELLNDIKLFSEIFNILDELYFVCHEFRSYQNFLHHFKSGRKYHFTKWHEDIDFEISINDSIILCNGVEYDGLSDFKDFLGMEEMDKNELTKLFIDEFTKNNGKLSDSNFNYLLYLKGGNIEELKKDISKYNKKLNKIGKGYELLSESKKYIKSFNNFIK